MLGRRVLVTGAAVVAEDLGGEFDLITDGVSGATFGLAIEHLRPRGVVVNIATVYTLNLPDELASHASGADDLTRRYALPPADGSMARLNSKAHGASRGPRLTPCSTAASAVKSYSTSTRE